MSEQTIYLVYSYTDYESPCTPIKAFVSSAAAEALVARCTAYHATRPLCPVNTMQPLTKEQETQFDKWCDEHKAWEKAHPGGTMLSRVDGFDVMAIPLVPKAEEESVPAPAVCNRNCDCVGECKAGIEQAAQALPSAGAEAPDAG